MKDGKLILEEYFHGFHREKIHQIRSATKSIGSILIGMAIDDHFIRDVDEKIYPFFKEYEVDKKWDERVRYVTLKTLLTMTSGYACDDHAFPSFQCERAMYKTNDWLENMHWICQWLINLENIGPMTLDSYVGEYQMGHIRILVINRHNNLFLELLGKSIRLFPEKTDLFFASDDVLGGLKIIFKRNDKLFVNSAIAHTNFQSLPFKKVK